MPSMNPIPAAVKLSPSVFPSQRLLLAGWKPGVPAHIKPETVQTDQRVCRSLRCPKCGHRGGMTYRAFGKGNRYACVADCPSCGHEEEV